MPSVKISELPILNQLSANNANTVFVAVDKTTNTTSQFSTTTLAEGLFANNVLNVGTSATTIYADAIAQFVSNTAPSSRVFFQNINPKGVGQIVIATTDGDEANGFINMGIRGSNMDYDAEFDLPNRDGFICMHGKDGEVYGNLWIGTHNSNNDIVFYTGSHTIAAEAVRVEDNGNLKLSIPLQFSDSTIQTTAASPAAVTLVTQANTIITQGVDATQNTRLDSIETINTNQNTSISIIEGVNLTQNTNITTANNHAWAAFTKANNALANTTGTFAGDLTVTGNLISEGGSVVTSNLYVGGTTTSIGTTLMEGNFTSNGTSNLIGSVIVTGSLSTEGIIAVNNSTFLSNTSLIKITASDGFVTQPPSNTDYMLHVTGKANTVTRVVIDSFGANSYPVVVGRMGRGSALAPVAVANNDVMMRIVGNGWTGTQFAPSSPTKIDFVAGENFSDTNRGTRIEFWNTPTGSNTIQKIADFNATSVEFTGTVNPQKGFIYNPTVLVGNQTAFTIDYSTTSLIKATLTADLTISHSDYVAGKVVEVWLTNTSGSTRTVTHGCSAINSSENSTTFTMASTSSAYLRYFSIGTDNANTFVAVQSA
jgi:hypothetical protein